MKIKKYLMLLLVTGLFFSCSSDDAAPAPPPSEPPPTDPIEKSTEADILTFTMTAETGAATINASDATVAIEVENGTDLSSLTPSFTLSTGASASPASGTAGDYSTAVAITVTAEDGTTTKAWTVNVTEAADGGGGGDKVEFGDGGTKATAIRDLVVAGVTYDVIFRAANANDVYSAFPGTFTFTTNADAAVAINAINAELDNAGVTNVGEAGATLDETRYRIAYESFDFEGTDNARFKIGFKEPDWKEGPEETSLWNEVTPLTWAEFIPAGGGGTDPGESTDTDILSFSFTEETGAATIDDNAHTVAIEVANGTELTTLTPAFTISTGATASPVTGTEGNYSSAVSIMVTAEDGMATQAWTVNVTEATAGGGGGELSVEFGDGGTKATAIRNLVVDGVTYDAIFTTGNANELYGSFPGTFTFNGDNEATVAVNAINDALNNAGANRIGEEGGSIEEPLYKMGYEAITVGVQDIENCRTKIGLETTGWGQGPEESSLWTDSQSAWVKFIEL